MSFSAVFRQPLRWLFLLVAALCFFLGSESDREERQRDKAEARLELAAEKGQRLATRDVLHVWMPRAWKIAGLLVLCCAFLWPVGQGGTPASLIPPAPVRTPRRHEWVMVWLAVLLLAGLASPRLQHGLWSDEHQSVADSMVGEVRLDDAGLPTRFVPLSWRETFYGYITPNNHVLYSVLARALHELKPAGGPEDPYFSTMLLRLPSFVFGVLLLVVTWRLVYGLFGSLPAGMALVAIGLHPWWMRYTTECRGYTLLLLILLLLAAVVCRALSTGLVRWWLLVGLLQLLALYTWPLAIHFVFWLNVGVALWLSGHRRKEASQWRFWLGQNLLSAAAAMVLMLPMLPQIKRYLSVMGGQTGAASSPLQLISLFFTGRSFHTSHFTPASFYPEWGGQFVGFLVLLTLAILLAAGACTWWRFHKSTRWLLLPMLVSPLVLIFAAVATNSVFHPWYLLPYLPGVMVLVALGASYFLGHLPRVPGTLALVAWAGLAVAVAAPVWSFQLRYPVEPAKEAAAYIQAPQTLANHSHPGIPSISVRSRHQLHIPTARQATTAEGLIAAVEEAKAAGRKHFHYECLAGLLVKSGNPMAAVLADHRYFKSKKAFFGTNHERPVTIHVAAHN